MNELNLPDSIVSIGERAFQNCSGFRMLNFNKNLNSIGQYAFSGCNGLVSLVLNENLVTLSNYAFANCANLTAARVPKMVTSFGKDSFQNCTKLTIYCYSGSAAHMALENTSYRYFLLDEHEHEYETTIETAATCTRGGSQIKTCTICSYNYIELVEALGHDYVSVDTAPTCTEKGYTTYTCLRCNDTYKDDYVDVIGHSYGNWETITEATCTKEGKKQHICSVCGNVATEVIPANGHSMKETIAVPTCTEQGYTHHYCENCSYVYNDTYIDAIGHRYSEWMTTKEPTCIANGEKKKICSVCGDVVTEVIPTIGHIMKETIILPTCTKRGYTHHHCAICSHTYNDSYVDALGHSYGDWIVGVEATVLAEGRKHRECSACEYIETQIIECVEIDISTNTNYGLAMFTVVNAQTLEPINKAQIFISTSDDGENTFTTDESGKVSVVLPIGKQIVSAYAPGCLTRNLKINIKPGVNEIPQIGLSNLSTYDAKITSTLMTIEEIEKAGIDTSDPSNQHVYKYELTLEFEAETVKIISYFNGNGDYIGPEPGPDIIPPPPPPGPEIPDIDITYPDVVFPEGEPTYALHYHVVDGGFYHGWCKKVTVEKGQNVELTYQPRRNNDDYIFDGWYEDREFTKKITSVEIEETLTYVYGRWIYIGEEEEPITVPNGIRVPLKDEVITVYPVSEYFYLIVRGEVKWLKEIFDVEMLIINNSMADTLEDLTATLELPEGLSLAKMVDEEQMLEQKLGNIGEGESKSVHWYVRGDTAGSYSLKAKLEGMEMPFENPIEDVFIAEDQIQVMAGDALHLHFEFPKVAYHGEDYPIKITLTNVSNITLYNISHMVQIEQGMVIYYSDGSKKERIELSDWFAYGVREFHPGDKIIIEASVNIFFESEIFKSQLQKLVDIVGGAEQLVNSMKATQAMMDATDSLINCVNSSLNMFENFDFTSIEDTVKRELFKALYSKIIVVSSLYADSCNKIIEAADSLANTGVNNALSDIMNDPDEWLESHSAADIKKLIDKVSALERSIQNNANGIKSFTIFDSVRLAISSIPVRFVLRNVIMREDENNTTSIPWSYSINNSMVSYHGITNVSNRLMSILKEAFGEDYGEIMEWYPQLIAALDDPSKREDTVQNIKATENAFEQFKAHDTTGEVKFKAWIECAEDGAFDISCDNKTATYANDVLTFTGDGMIYVMPKTQEGGTLYIEDSEGNIYTYVIDVVEEHACSAGEQQVVIAPTVDYDGFAVKCCSVCGDIMEIIPQNYEDCCKDHAFGEWITNTEATCTTAGVQFRTCTVCSYTEYRFTEIKDHSLGEWITDVEADCVADGEKHAVCSICGDVVTETIPANGHSMKETVVTPTCTEEGYTHHYCENCMYEYDDTYVDALGHSYGEWIKNNSGEHERICDLCGHTDTKTNLIIASGTCGKDLTWTLDEEGTLTISGTGYMTNYTAYPAAPWDSERHNIKKVIIEDGVAAIGHRAFYYCSKLASVVIPDSVKIIGEQAFEYCSSLTAVVIPDSVTSIGIYAFSSCSKLISITIPCSVASIGQYAFSGCYSLESITVDENNEKYSSDEYGVLFSNNKTWLIRYPNANKRTTYTIPDSVTSISNGAFSSCSNLTSVVIPDSVKSIGDRAFYNYNALTDVYYGGSEADWNNITIGSYNDPLINANIHFTDIECEHTYGEWITDAKAGCVTNGEKHAVCLICGDVITEVIPANGHSIKETVVIPTCTDEGYMHHYCENCTYEYDDTYVDALDHSYGEWEITTAPECETDGEKQKVCSLCDDVVTETIPASGHSMKETVIPPTCTEDGYTHHYCENCSYIYDDTYIDAAGHSFGDWKKNGSGEYERECSVCGHKEFCSALIVASGTFGENLTWILDSDGILTISGVGDVTNNISSFDAPWYNYRLMIKNVVIEDGVTSIGDYAFFDCSSLASVTIPDSVTSIGKGAFEFCESLTDVVIPESVTNIGDLAFYCCSKLSSITVSENNEYYSNDEFGVLFNKDKTELIQYPVGNEIKTYTIPETVISIGDYAFCKCLNLTSVTISESVKNIGDFAFSGCENLISVIISESVESIRMGAFNGCASLDNAYYYGDEEEWKNISADAGNDPLFNAKNIVFGYPDSMAVAIKVATLPKTVYSYGEELSLDGMSVGAVYHDGSVVNTTDYAVIGYDKYAFGYQTLTVVSGDLTCKLNVCVKPNEPNALTTPLEAGVTVAEFAEPYSALYSVYVFDNDKMTQLEDDDIIKTGCVVQFVRNKSVVDSVAIVVKGDATGDGVINGKDLIRIKKQILEGGAVEYIEYADVNCDGVVDEYDLDVLVGMI